MKKIIIFFSLFFVSINIMTDENTYIPIMNKSILSDIFDNIDHEKKDIPIKDPFMTDGEYQALLDQYKKNNLNTNTKNLFKIKLRIDVPCRKYSSHCYDPNSQRFIINNYSRTEYDGETEPRKFLEKTESGSYSGQTGIQKNIGTYSKVTKWYQYWNALKVLNEETEKIYFSQERDFVRENFEDYSFYLVFEIKPKHKKSNPRFKRTDYNEPTISNPTDRRQYERYLQSEYKYHFATLNNEVIFESIGDYFPLFKPPIIDYPKKALKRNIQGYVTVEFDVNKDGTTSSHSINASRCIQGDRLFSYGSKSVKEQMNGSYGSSCKLFNKSALKTAKSLQYNKNLPSPKSYTLYYLGY